MDEFNVGDIVRFKGGGDSFTLEDVNPNPDYKDDGEYYASGSDEYGYGNIEVSSPDEIELVMSAKDASKREVPSAEDIARGLNLLGDGWDGPVDVSETEEDGSSVICYGKTQDGLSVSFVVTVSSVRREGSF